MRRNYPANGGFRGRVGLLESALNLLQIGMLAPAIRKDQVFNCPCDCTPMTSWKSSSLMAPHYRCLILGGDIRG
jgi:hypothetical protein